MTSFAYLEPATLTEATVLLKKHGEAAKLLAGGTAVVLLIRQKLIHPEVLVSLDRLDEMRTISVDGGGSLHIGAITTLDQISSEKCLHPGWSLLAQACASVGNMRLRNQATLGGNLAEADYASDPPAALLALDAKIRAVSWRGERQVALADFMLGFYTTALFEDEILTEIILPPLPSAARSIYLKYKSRSALDRPCVGVAAILAKHGDICSMVRVAIGAVCETPQRFQKLEQELIGQRITPAVVEDFAAVYSAALVSPLDDMRGSAWYRREMARVHVRRALLSLDGFGEAS